MAQYTFPAEPDSAGAIANKQTKVKPTIKQASIKKRETNNIKKDKGR